MKRQLIIIGAGVLILTIAFGLANYMISNKQERPVSNNQSIKGVYTEVYVPRTVPVEITESGNLVAKHKVDLFSEVQGVLETSKKDFRTGVTFKKGEIMLKINADEHYSTLLAQKSILQNLIASVMPDIRLDYPDSYQAWSNYLNQFNINEGVKDLPEPVSDKEKYFITGRNIYSTFYNVKNLEARLEKFYLRAPYDGVLTETFVTTGTLVRPGQRIGEFIDPTVYELAVSINANLAQNLIVGEKVMLKNLDGTYQSSGFISRINGKLDINTQTLLCFVETRDVNLKAGMFLRAVIPGREFNNSFLISRKLLVNNESVYIVKGNVLDLVKVNTLYFNEDSVIISGLNKGDLLVSKAVAGAYPGMKINQLNK
ncbi:HlyD family efflux transporter periplasmic adaptor subunit [Flavobacteriaceae bacterium]|nr:HlyD family efflux transporter periplasmic adaptor subunit [Flavobacteriaceae bacterium]